ncbi:MAG TPA: hypothetical protein VE258_13190 [Ktedonobacterales bacterium]|nr:hypothetical protein [Ktedonobacterales bacterium]
MTPEDRLDALLTARQRAERERHHDNTDPTTGQHSLNGSADPVWEAVSDAELAPLLAGAQRLASLRMAQSDPAARALEARMLARATERRRQEGETFTQARGEQRDEPRTRRRFLPLGAVALRPALVAAALLLALGIATLTTAAAAGPGSPLFGLHRLEQRIQAGIAGDSPDRAHQHLQFARQWLAALREAAAQHRGDPTYGDALAALREEDSAAAQEIAQVSAGTQRAALEADLAALRADERTTLQAALLAIGWPDRIATTTALGALGVAGPRVSSATLAAGNDGRWHVTLTGAAFESGAVLLVDGQPAGTVTATSAGLLAAELPLEDFAQAPASLGVGNPDGTAAATDNVQVLNPGAATPTPGEQEGTPQPGAGATATPTLDNQGGRATPSPTDSSGGG